MILRLYVLNNYTNKNINENDILKMFIRHVQMSTENKNCNLLIMSIINKCHSQTENKNVLISQNTEMYSRLENGNGECVKETTSRAKSRPQSKATNESSTHRRNPPPEGRLRLALKQ